MTKYKELREKLNEIADISIKARSISEDITLGIIQTALANEFKPSRNMEIEVLYIEGDDYEYDERLEMINSEIEVDDLFGIIDNAYDNVVNNDTKCRIRLKGEGSMNEVIITITLNYNVILEVNGFIFDTDEYYEQGIREGHIK